MVGLGCPLLPKVSNTGLCKRARSCVSFWSCSHVSAGRNQGRGPGYWPWFPGTLSMALAAEPGPLFWPCGFCCSWVLPISLALMLHISLSQEWGSLGRPNCSPVAVLPPFNRTPSPRGFTAHSPWDLGKDPGRSSPSYSPRNR